MNIIYSDGTDKEQSSHGAFGSYCIIPDHKNNNSNIALPNLTPKTQFDSYDKQNHFKQLIKDVDIILEAMPPKRKKKRNTMSINTV